MANNHSDTERRLWDAADEFRANSDLKSSEYATPVLGLIFLRYADHRFTLAEKELEGTHVFWLDPDGPTAISILHDYSNETRNGAAKTLVAVGRTIQTHPNCRPGYALGNRACV